MSNAGVTFHSADMLKPASAAEAARFSFRCPNGRGFCSGLLIAGRTNLKRDPQSKDGYAMWDFDGNAAAPTFSPSVNCKGCWHGYIRKGRCVNTANQDEPEPDPGGFIVG